MHWRRFAAVTLLGLVSLRAWALQPYEPSAIEMHNLPVYCAARMHSGQNPAQYKLWARRLGPDFIHTHHYCFGLNFLNRYYNAMNERDKSYDLENAINNFNYMITHASPNFILMPEIYLNRGIAYLLMNNTTQGVDDLNKALKANPKLIGAYNALADYYKRSKQTKKALDIVTEGLKNIPESHGLKRSYDELGGKKPYPEPYAAAESIEDKKPDANRSATSAKTQGSQQVDSKGGSHAHAEEKSKEITEPAPAKIGTPSNPYCRFCPPE